MEQVGPYNMIITAIGCSNDGNVIHMTQLRPPVFIGVTGSYVFDIKCYQSMGGYAGGPLATFYKGWWYNESIRLNYTWLNNNSQQTAAGSIRDNAT